MTLYINLATLHKGKDMKKPIDEMEARELYGRMIEDTDIELAIESGQFKSLEDVRLAVKGRAASINAALFECGFLKLPQHTIDYSSGEAVAVSLN